MSCAAICPESASPPFIHKQKISRGDEPHLPESFDGPRCGSTVAGAYKMCVGQEGRVGSVEVEQGIPEADASIVETLRTWRYRPMAIPVCFVQKLEFRIECQKSRPPADAVEASPASEKPAEPPLLPAALMTDQKLSRGDEPPLPARVQTLSCGSALHAAYKLCVAPSGEVIGLEVVQGLSEDEDRAIAEYLRRWRFRPRLSPVCFIQPIDFPAPCTSP
jgi:hypothetical protein